MSCTRIMDTRLQEVEGFGEESSGKKKSKFKSIKKFFGKRKRKETLPSSGTGSLKLYQSTSDVTTSESMHVGYDSEDELEIHSSIMGSRALSHDSIFISEAAQEPARPVRVFSQENVSGRIRALQMKLQQNWKFGRSSPFGATSKRMDDAGMSSEDDGLPRSPPEMSPLQEIINSKTAQFSDSHKHLSSLSLAGTGSEEEEQVTSGSWRSCSAESQLIPRKSSVKIAVPISEGSLSPPGDFDTPPEFTTVLDNSAAKHKLLIKPRNQRSRKMRRLPSKSLSESQNDLSSTPEEDECERKEALAELIYDGVSSSCQALAESTASSNNVLYSRQLEMSKGLELGLSHQDEKSSMLHSASPLDLPPFENNSEGCQTGQGLTLTVPSLPSSEQKENITTLHLIPELGTQRDKECYETQKICPKNLSSSLNQENKNISDVPSKSSVLPDKSSSTKNDVLPTLDGTSKDTGTPALAEDLSSKVSSSLGNSPLPKSHFQLTDVAGPENSSYSSSPCIAAASQKGTPSTWSLDKMKLTQELPASDKENNPPPAPDVYIWGGKTEKENSELGALKKFSISSSRERLRTGSLSMKENVECEHPVNTQVLQTKIKGSSRDGKLKEASASQEKKNSTSKQTLPQSELESTGKGLCRVEPETLLQAINPASVPMNSGGGLPQQPGANQSESKDKNPFQVKLRSTSLSLRYRDSSSRESKETKRHSAEFNLEKEGLPSPLMKSERAEGRKTTDINIGDTLNETSKTKTKSPEQSGAKPPLPRKPVLQHAVITGTNTSSEKQEKVIKCPESKNEEQKNLEKSEVPEKSVPSPVSTVDAARGTESQKIPTWVTIAKQKQRVIEEELSREEKPVVYSKMDAEKQKKETERMEEAVKQQTDHTQATSLPLSSTVPSEEETKETKSNTQEMLPRPGLQSHPSPVPLEKEDTKLYKKVTHSASDQPLWMELAKKKSQAWSDMPPMIK